MVCGGGGRTTRDPASVARSVMIAASVKADGIDFLKDFSDVPSMPDPPLELLVAITEACHHIGNGKMDAARDVLAREAPFHPHWRLHPPGDHKEWDGLLGWFLRQARSDQRLRSHPYVKKWRKVIEGSVCP